MTKRYLISFILVLIPAVVFAGIGGGPMVTPDPLDESVPHQLEDIGLDPKLGAQVPADLVFTDHKGNRVKTGDYFKGDLPIVMNLAYYECPTLCNFVLNGTVDSMKGLPWNTGDKYRAMVFSIDHDESADLAEKKRASIVEYFGRDVADKDWAFHVGSKENIEKLAASVGFKYRYDKKTDQYAHGAVTIVLSPGGKVMRYLPGIEAASFDLKLSLLEAGEGKIGSIIDRVVLYCFHYDSTSEKFVLGMNIMRTGAGLTLFIMTAFAIMIFRREVAKAKARQLEMAEGVGR